MTAAAVTAAAATTATATTTTTTATTTTATTTTATTTTATTAVVSAVDVHRGKVFLKLSVIFFNYIVLILMVTIMPFIVTISIFQLFVSK